VAALAVYREHQQVVPAAAAVAMVAVLVRQAQQILAVAAVQAVPAAQQAQQAALVLSSFATLIHLQPQHLPQAHQQLLLLAATVSINGLVQGALHSDGTFCKTQF
jgi:hypothetical protein